MTSPLDPNDLLAQEYPPPGPPDGQPPSCPPAAREVTLQRADLDTFLRQSRHLRGLRDAIDGSGSGLAMTFYFVALMAFCIATAVSVFWPDAREARLAGGIAGGFLLGFGFWQFVALKRIWRAYRQVGEYQDRQESC